MLLNLFRRGDDGRTAWERRKGRSFKRDLHEFGKQVLYLKPGSAGKDKLDTRWEKGIFLGIREASGEWYIGTPNGVLKVHASKELSDDAERWNAEAHDQMQGTPWEPIPGREGIDVTTKTTAISDFVPRFSEPSDGDPQIRRMKMYKRDVLKYGATTGCPGCESALRGDRPKNHSEACRKRFEDSMRARGDPSLARAVQRLEKRWAA